MLRRRGLAPQVIGVRRAGCALAGNLLFGLLSSCTEPTTEPAPEPNLAPPPGDNTVELVVPSVQKGPPRPGARVRVTAPEYRGTAVHHLLYLPTDWRPDATYPVLVEYAGNGPFRNKLGDTCSGLISSCKLGYGISGGRGYLWVCLPFVSADGQHNQRQWWGDLSRTVAYCKTVVPRLCDRYGGDPKRIVLAGFSRGAIACNYVGLHDDRIASLWRGFVCHSHYDGVRPWNYPRADRAAATERLARLGNRPQWISHEQSVAATRDFLRDAAPGGPFVFHPLPFPNHSDLWVLRPSPDREALRAFVAASVR